MLGEEGAVTEGLPAPLAPEGLLAAVDALVAVQRGEPRERAAALSAGVWLLARVRAAVLHQVRALAERAAALPAHVRLLAAVRGPVSHQAREVPEALGACFARVGSLPFRVSLTGPGARAMEKFGSPLTSFLGTFCFGDGPVGSVWLSLLEKEVLKAP